MNDLTPCSTEDLDIAIPGLRHCQSPPKLVDHQVIWSGGYRLGINILNPVMTNTILICTNKVLRIVPSAPRRYCTEK